MLTILPICLQKNNLARNFNSELFKSRFMGKISDIDNNDISIINLNSDRTKFILNRILIEELGFIFPDKLKNEDYSIVNLNIKSTI